MLKVKILKLKYIFIIVVFIGLITGCKSKKRAVRNTEQTKEEVIVNPIETPGKKKNVVVRKSMRKSTEDYIEKYKDIAMEEMRIFRIPSSITLAQGIIESSSGNSELTKKSNNHFGIKCHKGWNGDKVYHNDDKKGECFRVYIDPLTSFRDHSVFLVGRERYSKLFKLKKGDYVRWARGLSEAGYATDRRYPAKLIALIEKYDLDRFDKQVLGKSYKKTYNYKPTNHIVVKGDTLYSISKRYGLTVDELKKMNGLNSNAIDIGQTLILMN